MKLLDVLFQRLSKIVNRLPAIARNNCLQYGRAVLTKTRMGSHLNFLRTCLSENVIPKGFKLRTHYQFSRPGLVQSSQSIQNSFSRRMMRLKLYEFHCKFDTAADRLTSSLQNLQDMLNQHELSLLRGCVYNLNGELYSSLQSTKSKKLEALRHSSPRTYSGGSKTVVTIPEDLPLDPKVREVLSKGAKFIPTPTVHMLTKKSWRIMSISFTGVSNSMLISMILTPT